MNPSDIVCSSSAYFICVVLCASQSECCHTSKGLVTNRLYIYPSVGYFYRVFYIPPTDPWTFILLSWLKDINFLFVWSMFTKGPHIDANHGHDPYTSWSLGSISFLGQSRCHGLFLTFLVVPSNNCAFINIFITQNDMHANVRNVLLCQWFK